MSLLVAAVLGALAPAKAAPPPTAEHMSGGITLGARTDLRAYPDPDGSPDMDYSASALIGGYVRSTRLTLRAVYAPSFVDQALLSQHSPASAGMLGFQGHYYSFQEAGSIGLSYLIVPLKRFTLTFGLDGSMAWSAAPLMPYVPNAPANQQQPNQQQQQTNTNAPALDANGMPQTQGPALPAPGTPTTIGGKALPYNVVATTGSLRATLTSIYRFTRRLSLGNSVFATTAGGIDVFSKERNYQSQVLAPINRSVGGTASLSYALSREDRISTNLSASYNVVLLPALSDGTPQPSSDAVIGSITESYSRLFSKWTVGSIGAGFSAATSKIEGQGRANISSATGDALLAYTRPVARDSTLVFRAGATYGLGLNVYAGGAQHFATGTVGTGWRTRHFNVNLAGDFSSTIDATPETQTVTGSATIGYTPVPVFQLLVGTSVLHLILPPNTVFNANMGAQQQAMVGGPPIFIAGNTTQWSAFIAASVTAPVLAF